MLQFKSSLGGANAVITVVWTLPFLFRKIWRTQLSNLDNLPHPEINHPRMLTIGALIVLAVLVFKEYIVNAGFVGKEILDPNFTGQLPAAVLPLFYAMMYGATLGGNGTLVGAFSNIVAAGIAEQHSKRISFGTFLYYGIPIMLLQLGIIAIYVTIAFLRG